MENPTLQSTENMSNFWNGTLHIWHKMQNLTLSALFRGDAG
jgi:hypothetical protein